jgi:hypothetical protein
LTGVTSLPMRRLIGGVVVIMVLAVSACAGDDDNGNAATTSGRARATTTTTAAAAAPAPVLFSPQGNNLDAYSLTPPFAHQRVVTNHDDDPKGWDINGEVCFLDGHTFVAGEDTGQPNPPAGWAVFDLQGDRLGEFSARRVTRLVPTYQPSDEYPDNYGCGVLSDGRVVTTVIGNNASGPEDGELLLWFPPFDGSRAPKFCVLDTTIGTGQGIAIGDDGAVYVASARGATAGVLRYAPPFPTAPDAKGGCGKADPAGSPMAGAVHRTKFITPSATNFLSSPNGVVHAPDGTWFVSSIINGVIAQFRADGTFLRKVLEPPAGETLGPKPYTTGTPLGLDVADDGTLLYADLGLVIDKDGIGPGHQTGTVRRIRFVNGAPQPPETIADRLTFPDGLGIRPAA